MSRFRQAILETLEYNTDMSEEDRKYLRSAIKMRPSLEIFQKMVYILRKTREKTDQLLNISLVISSLDLRKK